MCYLLKNLHLSIVSLLYVHMKTKLQYLTDQEILTFDALVVDVKEDDGKTIVVLDSTYFYPQGGGQPCDQGIIQVQNGVLDVQEVYCRDGVVSHIGKLIQGNLVIGDKVTCDIDESRRILNSRIHSAGHVVDFAARKAGYLWTPSKRFSLYRRFVCGVYRRGRRC